MSVTVKYVTYSVRMGVNLVPLLLTQPRGHTSCICKPHAKHSWHTSCICKPHAKHSWITPCNSKIHAANIHPNPTLLLTIQPHMLLYTKQTKEQLMPITFAITIPSLLLVLLVGDRYFDRKAKDAAKTDKKDK